MLVADMMTIDGEVKQIGRHGIAEKKTSVLSRAAFESTVNHFARCRRPRRDRRAAGVPKGLWAQPISIGTGDVRLIAKTSKV